MCLLHFQWIGIFCCGTEVMDKRRGFTCVCSGAPCCGSLGKCAPHPYRSPHRMECMHKASIGRERRRQTEAKRKRQSRISFQSQRGHDNVDTVLEQGHPSMAGQPPLVLAGSIHTGSLHTGSFHIEWEELGMELAGRDMGERCLHSHDSLLVQNKGEEPDSFPLSDRYPL